MQPLDCPHAPLAADFTQIPLTEQRQATLCSSPSRLTNHNHATKLHNRAGACVGVCGVPGAMAGGLPPSESGTYFPPSACREIIIPRRKINVRRCLNLSVVERAEGRAATDQAFKEVHRHWIQAQGDSPVQPANPRVYALRNFATFQQIQARVVYL